MIEVFEQNSMKEKLWNSGIARFLQNGGVVEQAIGVFEVTPKIETENNIILRFKNGLFI